MSKQDYIAEFKQDPKINNPDYLEGLIGGLTTASLIADDLKINLAGNKEYLKVLDYLEAHQKLLWSKHQKS
jgi:hypothetical protein